jgi:hypothetical protein
MLFDPNQTTVRFFRSIFNRIMLDIRMHGRRILMLRNNAVRSSFILFAMLISVFGISVGRAQETIDVAKITCDQFLAGRVTDSRTLSIWLSGYYNGTRHNTVVNVSEFQKHSTDLMDYCISHPDMNLMDAIKNALGADK